MCCCYWPTTEDHTQMYGQTTVKFLTMIIMCKYITVQLIISARNILVMVWVALIHLSASMLNWSDLKLKTEGDRVFDLFQFIKSAHM